MTIQIQAGAPAAAAPSRREPVPSRPVGVLADIRNVFVRELQPVLRQPASVLFAMVQPLVFLGLFAPLLPDTGAGSALQWFVPGIVSMTALMSASFTGANLSEEIISGSFERLLVSPVRRSSLLVGKALRELVPLVLQTLIIVAVVTPFSFELHPAGVLAGIVVLVPFSVGLGALSLALAVAAKDQSWVFWTVQQTAIFPLLLLAGVLLPLDGAPGWLEAAADANPLKYVVDAERALFAGSFPVDTVGAGLAASVLVGALGLWVGVRTMNRAA
ncbi:ABC transporter permease [Nocardioides sp. TF02-7]|uniref:ABC transporter permease n=1 Tax=Nocardioides sp. TF02-7 TaxID=2917724 RepID=UPI001F0541CA|nr:ABC transporter permease [Nocardioides sp. TF02-7]UMG93277.1 ABC transporter permease [Nocardioides sp. TF02-7]